MKDLIEQTTLYFRATGRCNGTCEWCYRDSYDEKDPSAEFTKSIIDKSADLGFRRFGLLGGEIFLRTDVEELLAYVHKRGLQAIVASNGSLIGPKEIDILNKYVTWLGLPLDGSTSDKSGLMRKAYDQYQVTTGLLKQLKNPQFKVRISTVVCQLNKDDLLGIGKILFETPGLYVPDGWRLERFLPMGKGQENKDKFALTKEEYIAACRLPIHAYANSHNVTCTNSNYLIVNPQGVLLLSKESQYIPMGRFLDMKREDILGIDILAKTASNSSWRR